MPAQPRIRLFCPDAADDVLVVSAEDGEADVFADGFRVFFQIRLDERPEIVEFPVAAGELKKFFSENIAAFSADVFKIAQHGHCADDFGKCLYFESRLFRKFPDGAGTACIQCDFFKDFECAFNHLYSVVHDVPPSGVTINAVCGISIGSMKILHNKRKTKGAGRKIS